MLMLYMSMIDSSEEKRKFERLYLAHKQTMYYVALGILKDVQEAEDAVHQAFLRVMDRLDKIDEQDCHKTRAYLVVITESTAIDIYRKRKRARTVSFDELEIYISSDIESEGCDYPCHQCPSGELCGCAEAAVFSRTYGWRDCVAAEYHRGKCASADCKG